MPYQSTKRYGHDVGLSCCFRQHRATHSHCSLLHGYAISVELVFQASELDHRNWVIDFGGLGEIKDWLKATFDHKTLVAQDDPALDHFQYMDDYDLIDLVVVPRVGCEAFAELVYSRVEAWLVENGHCPRVRLLECRVKEHGANGAVYYGD